MRDIRIEGGEAQDGIKAIIDQIDSIGRIKTRLIPVLALMGSAGELNAHFDAVLTNGELGDIAIFLRDELEEVFEAVDSIYAVYRRSLD